MTHRPPSSIDASVQLAAAAAHLAQGRFSEAQPVLAALIAAHDGRNPTLLSRTSAMHAQALLELDRRTEALAAVEAALAGKPDAASLDLIGVIFARIGLHERAAAASRLAAGREPTPGRLFNLASTLSTIGAFDEARAAYRACLRLAPRHALAWHGLVQITRQTPAASEAEALKAAFARAEHPAARHAIGHALAKTCEDLGDIAGALEWLEAAKRGVRARYDAAEDAALFAAAGALDAAVAHSPGHGGCRPIFIAGLPRTGTTLIERIVSSHPDVASAGELNAFPAALARAGGGRLRRLIDADLIASAPGLDLAAVGRDYEARVRGELGLTGRFVDKLPLNAFLVPAILGALPDARVILVRRHAADTVLSLYRQMFGATARNLDYSLDLEATARHVVAFEQLVSRLSAEMPADRFMLVSYEDVVADVEGQARRMLDLCGLPFDPACVDFHANATPVATASAAQVRQPVYATSIGRWRRWRAGIEPALKILSDAGLLPDDSAA